MDCSSAHDLDKVFALFAADATYTSESLNGTWTGLQAIQDMMRPFYAKFPDVTWEVTRMFVADHDGSGAAASRSRGLGGLEPDRPDDGTQQRQEQQQQRQEQQQQQQQQQQQRDAEPSGGADREGVVHVEVHFIRRWTEDAAPQESKGREWISVDARRGCIVHVHVAKLGAFWDFW